MECDGSHMRNSAYDGVYLTLLGKYGNCGNVLAAFAFVQEETTDSFAWFHANCLVAGIRLYNRPIFTD
ncbi:hypothetical protein GQ600_10451 [Phytophthora cactorum]|nr:hypothetical protein GQ600_10451 [Phytophthora cactorum]